MDTSKLVLRLAKKFFAGTVLSRISGALRDASWAVCFGSAPEIAAFMVAFRFAYLFRRLLGDGSLQAGFIPHFSTLQEKTALFFYRDCLFSLSCFLLFIVFTLEGILWGISSFLNPDWSEIIFLSMRMLPGLFFISLYALNSAFLQTQKKYFLSGFAPVFFNICCILIAFLVAKYPIKEAMHLLAYGIPIAFAMQWAVTLIQTRKFNLLSWGEWLRPRLFTKDLKTMLKPISLGILGVGATQLNSALDAIFSRFSELSGPVYLWNAIRIEQLPLALFGIALSGALLPPLSRAMAEGALDRYASLLHKALIHSAILIVPCTFGLFALGGPGLNLLYGHGHFTTVDVQQTLYCLWGYSFGLLPSVMILLLATGFYAKKSYSAPTIASLVSIGFHVALNSFLVFGLHLGAFSIAISTSLASFVNCAVLIHFCKVGVFARFWGFLARLTFCGCFATLVTFYATDLLTHGDLSRSFTTQIAHLFILSFIFLISFAFPSYIILKRANSDELKEGLWNK